MVLKKKPTVNFFKKIALLFLWYKKGFFLFKLHIADIILILLVLLACKIVICGYD